MPKQTEPEFVMDRLCESMARYVRNEGVARKQLLKRVGRRDDADEVDDDNGDFDARDGEAVPVDGVT